MHVNSIRVRPNTQSQQRFGIAEIEELSQTDGEQESPEEESHGEVNVNPITVNRVPIGEACSPYEVIQVQTGNRLVSVVIIYDTWSEVSLCNDGTEPMVTSTKEERKRIELSTINSAQTRLIQVCNLDINNGQTIEAVMIPNMKFQLQPQIIPNYWQDLEGIWANQDT